MILIRFKDAAKQKHLDTGNGVKSSLLFDKSVILSSYISLLVYIDQQIHALVFLLNFAQNKETYMFMNEKWILECSDKFFCLPIYYNTKI